MDSPVQPGSATNIARGMRTYAHFKLSIPRPRRRADYQLGCSLSTIWLILFAKFFWQLRTDRRLTPMQSELSFDQGWRGCLISGVAYTYLTSLAAVLGICFGADYLTTQPGPVQPARLIERFAQWDGRWYKSVVVEGYDFRPGEPCNVAFSPLFPWMARAVGEVTGLDAEWSMVLVANAALAGAAVVMLRYCQERSKRAAKTGPARQAGPTEGRGDPRWAGASLVPPYGEYATLAMLMFPTAMFFRCAYSESTFLFLVLLAMYGMERRWPLAGIALVAGLATAARPVGVAVLLPLAMHVWERMGGGTTRGQGDKGTR